ncbi:secondary thiamine-phosphate synthase enzyme YjbQ, partial [Salmonella enterica subsp. enterica serovar 1,4,[5],12:i:-]|nr:secondary thiamine-phosphate synthase enzyme YjbQ [Salmonella enterica subsp. enterica serovar 1,4,[5],12:i:-]
ETFLNKIEPEGTSAPWKHTLECPDDMPAHIKSSLFGCALTIPITNGKLKMGTWQGIWICEHRDHPTARNIVVTLNGIFELYAKKRCSFCIHRHFFCCIYVNNKLVSALA